MTIKYATTIIIFVLLCLFLTDSVGAAIPISTIRPGNAVFIGEQGLDITAAMEGDTILGWWASRSSNLIQLPTKNDICVEPCEFFC